MPRHNAIVNSFLSQAKWCETLESPFTAALVRAFAADFTAQGIIYRLCKDWPTDPVNDALGLRIAGGLHFLVLSGKDKSLASKWPALGANWDISNSWDAGKRAIENNFNWFENFIKSPPQTNEVRRSAALYAGICAISKNWNGPIDILELGASAGLNQNLDSFDYELLGFKSSNQSGVKINTEWRGNECADLANLKFRNRAACDQSPLDASNPDNALILQSYLWPDQRERLTRVSAAINIAQLNHTKVDKADALDWVKEKMNSRANDALTIIFHSVFFIYPPEETKKAINEAIRNQILNSNDNAPLVWLRFENASALFETRDESNFDDGFILDYIEKPIGESSLNHRTLATLDPHCRWINWRG